MTELTCLTPNQKWLKLWSTKIVRGGKEILWTFASRKEKPEVAKDGDQNIDAVIICAVVPISCCNDEDRIVVTSEFRYPINDYEIGLPAGLIDASETPLQAAERELKEETGLDIMMSEPFFVTPKLYSSAGMSDESCVIVFCNAWGEVSSRKQEQHEEIETMLLTRKEAYDLCMSINAHKISAKAWPLLFQFAIGDKK